MSGSKNPEKFLDNCIVCETRALETVRGFDILPRITSDCRPYAPGGFLAVCRSCGAVQKRADDTWLREIREIYSGYAAYYQSGGDEQIVFDRRSGRPRRRSDVILERLVAVRKWPANGTALDVGCGNGVTLASISATLPGWDLNGFEIGDEALAKLKTISGFEKLYCGSLESVDESFDLVTLIHSLEHFPAPGRTLKDLSAIVEDGKLFIEVCNVDENPFDILVADHLMHFSPETLSNLLGRCGFVPVIVASDLVPKEISVLAEKKNTADTTRSDLADNDPIAGHQVLRRMETYVRWLNEMVESVRWYSSRKQPLGVFGTSIAATWLASQLGDRLTFFVDEDESRVGKRHMGHPILHPRAVPAGSAVYLALAPGIAEAIGKRLGGGSLELILPPVMPVG